MSDVDVLSLVSLAGGALGAHVRDRLRERGFVGLSTRHGYVFQRLQVEPHSISDLARTLDVTQQAMSKTVAELAGSGYVETVADPRDARRKSVQLTARARAAIDAARQIRAELRASVLQHVTVADVDRAGAVLTVLLDQLGVGARIAERSVPDPTEE
ncbi:MarR family winged helix-turn-helix transcriptional regulator [Microbacterium koreense]|uniref:MarR family winged helix-turn-helix transcriptional regulator n=1 Tax=Microbacterium koreense TaxID=323761 RepID=A0ABW2ZP94_9MICO